MEVLAEQVKGLWAEMTGSMQLQLQMLAALCCMLMGIGIVRVLFRPTRPEDTSPAAMALRSKLAKALAPAQVEAWVTAMMPMTDAIQEGLRDCSGDFRRSLETISKQIGNLFQVHTAKFQDYVAEANEGVREAMVQIAATMTLLEPLRDLAQPLNDLVKPLQALVGQLKTVFSEAMAPCNKNLVLLQKKVEEELAKTVTQINGTPGASQNFLLYHSGRRVQQGRGAH